MVYECVGGPLCGESRALPRAARDFAERINGTWHRYALQTTDCGWMLVYVGPVMARSPVAPG